jgi:xanthine dehydrogenase YagR molybdenum-binding subunit
MTKMRLAVLDLPEGNAMRARRGAGHDGAGNRHRRNGEKLKMDPITFRIINDTTVDPAKRERKFSSAALSIACARGRSASAGTSAIRAGQDARWPLAGRHRRGVGVPQQPGAEVRRPCGWTARAS